MERQLRGEPSVNISNSSEILALRMPAYTPVKSDDYHCASFALGSEQFFITQFRVEGTAERAHHMLLYECIDVPNHSSSGWDCGHHGVCRGPSKILFAWAKNAPPTTLPPSVGFRLGGKDKAGYLVLQIHYAHVLPEGEMDQSGMDLVITTEEQKYIAGIFILWSSYAAIPPFQPKTNSDISCQVRTNTTLHFFAFRTHAHALGKVISGYKVSKATGKVEEIAKGNPQWPQAFYPMTHVFDINNGDNLLARCTFDSTNRNRTTHIGPTAGDEMCNLYNLYYTDAKNGQSYYDCMDDDFSIPSATYFPVGSDDPLPPNPLLEEHAHGSGHETHNLSSKADLNLEKAIDYNKLFKTETSADVLAVPEKKSHSYADIPVKHIHRKPGVAQDPELYYQPIAAGKQELETVPDDYTSDPQWKFSIKSQPSAVALDSKGNVIVFHRANRAWDARTFDYNNVLVAGKEGLITQNTLMMLDSSDGHLIQETGANLFYLPHGLTVDSNDQLWLTDVGSHQVFKLTALDVKSNQLKVLLQLGKQLEPGSGDYEFCQPSSVAVLPNGDFFVADGYCNSRVVRFNKDGVRMYQFGDNLSSSPGFLNLSPKAMYVVHSLALVPEQKLICTADRENGRILCFSIENGSLMKVIQAKEFGQQLFAIAYSSGYLYAVNGATYAMGASASALGFIIDMREEVSRIVGQFGTKPSSRMMKPHNLALAPNASSIYVAEIGPYRVDKFTRESSVKSTSGAATGAADGQVIDVTKSSSNFEIPPFSTSLVVLSILALPLLILVAVFSIVRLRQRGGCSRRERSQPLDLGSLLGHRNPTRGGFEKLAMEDSEDGEDLDSDSDADVVEFTKAKRDANSTA